MKTNKNNLTKGDKASGESPFEFQYYQEKNYDSSKNKIRGGEMRNKISQIKDRIAEISIAELLMDA